MTDYLVVRPDDSEIVHTDDWEFAKSTWREHRITSKANLLTMMQCGCTYEVAHREGTFLGWHSHKNCDKHRLHGSSFSIVSTVGNEFDITEDEHRRSVRSVAT